MTNNSDPELLAFAGDLIEKRGGLIERLPDRLLAVLPSDLAGTLALSEEVILGTDATSLLYGSPFLDRLVALATSEVPMVYGQIEVPYLKKAGFEELLGKDLRFADGQVRVSARAEARTTYMILTCRYVALSDERKEGLLQIGVHEVAAAAGLGAGRGKSGLRRAQWWVTPTGGNPRESATENKLPKRGLRRAGEGETAG